MVTKTPLDHTSTKYVVCKVGRSQRIHTKQRITYPLFATRLDTCRKQKKHCRHRASCCSVNFDTGTVSCPCRFYEEHFQPCSDAIAVIVACGKDPNDILFFGSINTTANYVHQYSCAPMSFGRIVLNLQEAKQLDPKHVIAKKPGRPNKKIKKRMERQELGLGVRVCPGCGMKGHFISSCTQFNLGMAAYKRESRVKLALKKCLVKLSKLTIRVVISFHTIHNMKIL